MNGNDQANDSDVLCAISDVLSRLPVARPPQLAAVTARGRTRQRRRRTTSMAAALAAVAAVTVTALPAGSHPTSPPVSPLASPQLAAWTVIRQANGNIHVTISEMTDPAGLQRTLRADGVPVSVTSFGQQNPACRPLGHDPRGLFRKIVRPSGVEHQPPGGGRVAMDIDPAAIPTGVGLQMAFGQLDGTLSGQFGIGGHLNLVRASQQCTGS